MVEEVTIKDVKKSEKGLYIFFEDYKGRNRITLVTHKGMVYLNRKDFLVDEKIKVEKRVKNNKIFYMVVK